MDWLKNPTILMLGGVGVLVVYILFRNKTPPQSSVTSVGDSINTGPFAASNSYLDGNGVQHIVATDPYGNLDGYGSLPPDVNNPQMGQLSSYAGLMSGQYLVPPYGGTTPYYS